MADEPFYSPNLKPAPPRQAQPGEKLFEFLRGHDCFLCELRDHGEVYGVEAQFYQNEEFLVGRRFDRRILSSAGSHAIANALEAGAGRVEAFELGHRYGHLAPLAAVS
jgi:hypothetical protein